MLPRLAMLPVRRAAERSLFDRAVRLSSDGFVLADSTGGDQSYELLLQIQRGLQLIARFDRLRYDRMRRDMPRIMIVDDGGARYWLATHVGVLDRSLVRERSAATIAIMLVHVAARARFANLKFGGWIGPGEIGRIAQRATRDQISFASRLTPSEFPGVELLLAHLEQQLAGYGMLQ